MNKRFNYPRRLVQTTSQAFREDFPGASLSALWDAPVLTGAATLTLSGSNLVLGLTTGATDSVVVTSKASFTIPCRLSISLLLSARSANQQVMLELISSEYKRTGGTTGHYARWLFDGTTATSAKTRTRNTDTEGVETTRTISTTAANVRIYTIDLGYDDVRFSQILTDSTAARGGAFVHTLKVPDANEEYYIRITAKNTGASTALTATVDFVALQDVEELMAEVVGGTGFAGPAFSIPVAVQSTVSTAITGTATVSGPAAHDAAVSGNPVRVAGTARTSITAVATGDTADVVTTLQGYQVVRPNSIPENEWQYAPSAAITNTTDVVLTAAGAAGIRNYLTGLQLKGTNAVATEVVVKDGATVIWRGYLSASMTGMDSVTFSTPLKGTAATALNFACITTAANVYVNAQGYKAP